MQNNEVGIDEQQSLSAAFRFPDGFSRLVLLEGRLPTFEIFDAAFSSPNKGYRRHTSWTLQSHVVDALLLHEKCLKKCDGDIPC